MASSRWHGNLDVAEHNRIGGWARDLDQPDSRLLLRIFDNGIAIADVLASLYREDLQTAGIGTGEHAFRLDLPLPLARGQRHVIEVRRADDGRLLHGSPQVLEAELEIPLLPVTETIAAPWRGHLDSVSRERIEGWAYDPRDPTTPMALVVVDNGEVIAKVLANRYRKDLEAAGIG